MSEKVDGRSPPSKELVEASTLTLYAHIYLAIVLLYRTEAEPLLFGSTEDRTLTDCQYVIKTHNFKIELSFSLCSLSPFLSSTLPKSLEPEILDEKKEKILMALPKSSLTSSMSTTRFDSEELSFDLRRLCPKAARKHQKSVIAEGLEDYYLDLDQIQESDIDQLKEFERLQQAKIVWKKPPFQSFDELVWHLKCRVIFEIPLEVSGDRLVILRQRQSIGLMVINHETFDQELATALDRWDRGDLSSLPEFAEKCESTVLWTVQSEAESKLVSCAIIWHKTYSNSLILKHSFFQALKFLHESALQSAIQKRSMRIA